MARLAMVVDLPTPASEEVTKKLVKFWSDNLKSSVVRMVRYCSEIGDFGLRFVISERLLSIFFHDV